MPDWTEDLRQRLAPLRLSPSRESEIIEELSQHLDLRYEELRDGGAPDVEARSHGWGGPHYGGGLLGLVLIILLILWLTGNIGGGMMIR
jgi:hypothetical protein